MKKEMSRAQRRRQAKIRKMLLSLSMVLVLALAAVGGTIAWLTDITDPVVNTFTVGDINITLGETTKDYKMVPGNTIAKDPKVTVLADSEACWLFVKIDKNATYGNYLKDYPVAANWIKLESATTTTSAVYYRAVPASNADQPFYVLAAGEGEEYANGYVEVKDEVTKAQLDAVAEKTVEAPTLTFTAYAIQKDNFNDPAAAWAEVSK